MEVKNFINFLDLLFLFYFIENDIDQVLDKSPDVSDVVELLANYACDYKRLAIVLRVDRGFVRGLKGDNVDNLYDVIAKWKAMRRSSITWNTIIKAVETKTFGKNTQLKEDIIKWLKEDDNFDCYRKRDN